jgi:hypothetical protein
MLVASVTTVGCKVCGKQLHASVSFNNLLSHWVGLLSSNTKSMT